MPESITIYAESVDDISANGHDALEVTLSGVDINNVIAEVGQDSILDEISTPDIEEYLESRKEREAEEKEELSA